MSKFSVLFLNHKVHNCGVYQYGKRVVEILQKDNEINYIYNEIDSYQEYCSILSESVSRNENINAIIYNYHVATMSWLNSANIQRKVRNIGIPHESPEHLFDIICNIDPTAPEGLNRFSLPRPIYENVDEIILQPVQNDIVNTFINKYTDTNLPIFGSFGFGFDNKGFNKIINMVNDQYDNAVIKFVIPVAHFDPEPNRIHRMRNQCINSSTKPGIELIIIHEFLSTADILRFLKSNTMNIFLYDKMDGRGISSTIDYAISVKKPLAISDSYMFRNIYSDKICLYKNTIDECLQNSVEYCSMFLEEYSHDAFIKKFRHILY